MQARRPPAQDIDRRLDDLASHPFRARFHRRGRERALVTLRGRDAIRRHAQDLVGHRALTRSTPPQRISSTVSDEGAAADRWML